MRDRRFLALFALVFSWPATARAQITILEKVGDKTVVCSHAGLTSSFKDCGVRATNGGSPVATAPCEPPFARSPDEVVI
jgi:hypothetical protein